LPASEPLADALAHGLNGSAVALTGATGFIGGRLLRRLAGAGIAVRALHRGRLRSPGSGVVPVQGALTDSAALDALVTGVGCVIHCAGAVRGRDRRAFDAVNVDGTRALVDALGRRAPGARLVLVSSLAAREPGLSDYAASKRAGEAVCAASDLATTTLRPTAVYGPGDRELRPLLALMARGLALHPAVPGARVTLVHVDDVVRALLACANPAARAGGCYEASDARGDGYSWPEIAATAASVAERRVRTLAVPPGALRALGRCNQALGRMLHHAPMLTPGKARELCHPDWRCNIEPLRRELGWTPRVDLADGLADTLARQ